MSQETARVPPKQIKLSPGRHGLRTATGYIGCSPASGDNLAELRFEIDGKPGFELTVYLTKEALADLQMKLPR